VRAAEHEENTNPNNNSRTESDEKKIPKQYEELEKALKTTSAETKVEVTPFDPEEKKLKWSITNGTEGKEC
jgi:hypothetical protein